MKHKFIALILLSMLPGLALSQFEKQWEMYIPTNSIVRSSYSINLDNHLKTVRQSDGSFVTLGSKQKLSSEFGDEIFIFSYDTNGNLLWEYTYQGINNINEYPYDIVIDHNDNVIIAARTTTFYHSDFEQTIEHSDCLIFMLNSEGEIVWEKILDFENESIDYFASLVITENSEIFSLSSIRKSCFLHKYDLNGNEIWSKQINNEKPHKLELYGEKLICATKFRYILPEVQASIHLLDMKGTKLDSFHLPSESRNWPKFDLNKNLYHFDFNREGEYRIEKLSISGVLQWTYLKESNLPPNVIADELIDCTIDDHYNVYVTGRYYGTDYDDTLLYSNCDILTAKLDSAGSVVWENIYKYDHTPLSCQVGQAIQLDSDGNIYVAGSQSVEVNGDVLGSDDMVILKYNQSGERTDSIYFNSIYDQRDYAINLNFFEDDLYVYGYSENLEGTFEMTVVKYSKATTSTSKQAENEKVIVFPNPINSSLNFLEHDKTYNIELWSFYGELMFSMEKHNTDNALALPGNLQNGMYILKLTNDLESKLIQVIKNDH